MEHVMKFLAAMLIVVFCTNSLLGSAATHAEQGDLRVTRSYPANSPAVAQVHRWLLEQPSRLKPPASAAALGQVRTSYFTHAPGADRRTDLTSTEVAFPVRGHSGDEVGIDACGAGIRYQWKYRWMSSSANAGWRLLDYQFKQVQDCDAAMADPGFVKPAAPRS
ncbi:hypothetical protein E1J24_16175 [Xanthomonas hortorum pv. pelargonii]|uniref:Uncharacterized protein n=2 Tax=Xanthomonas hortorum pv. pelargonii TaxID=453602 RepID=A0AAW9ZTM2_9XANT|nr:hypothetical protein [Xanthomonas hortorum pv. pelargonii]